MDPVLKSLCIEKYTHQKNLKKEAWKTDEKDNESKLENENFPSEFEDVLKNDLD